MPIDRAAAEDFVWSTARLLDRHRYALLFGNGPAAPVIEALRAYRNPDGGFGHALEPDLRCPASQPAPTLYALEILHEAGASHHELAHGARLWIASIAGPEGGIRSVLPDFKGYPHAPWWTDAGQDDEPRSFLTLGLAAVLHAAGVTDDRWLARATEWSWHSIETDEPGGYWLKYALAFLDAVPDEERAREAIRSLEDRMDASALAPAGGVEGEMLRPLDLSPHPGSRSRELVGQVHIDAHLDMIEAEQQDDGGWMFDWLAWSPAQQNDWRGTVTIRALTWLREHGRLP